MISDSYDLNLFLQHESAQFDIASKHLIIQVIVF